MFLLVGFLIIIMICFMVNPIATLQAIAAFVVCGMWIYLLTIVGMWATGQ